MSAFYPKHHYEVELNDGTTICVKVKNKDYNRLKKCDWEDTIDNLSCLIKSAGAITEDVDISNIYDIEEHNAKEKYKKIHSV